MATNAIITITARKKLVQARAGAISLPKITGMVFGNGGVDENGDVITPTETQTELNSQLLRKEISGYEFLDDTTCRYTATLAENECVGEDISEIGLYDAEGDIICIKNFTAKGKDEDLEMTFTLDDCF